MVPGDAFKCVGCETGCAGCGTSAGSGGIFGSGGGVAGEATAQDETQPNITDSMWADLMAAAAQRDR